MADDTLGHFLRAASMTELETVIKQLRLYEMQHPGGTVREALAHYGQEWEKARAEWGVQRDKLDVVIRGAAGLSPVLPAD